MLNTDGSAYNGTGIINGSVCNSTVGSNKSNYSSSVLVGFIYLTESVNYTVTIGAASDKNTISDNNAVLWGRVDKPSSYAVTKIGIKVRAEDSTYDKGWSKYDTPSQSYTGSTYMYPYYDLKSELGAKLKHATKYCYQFYSMVNGKEYWSSELSFTTTGSHSYSSWKTVSNATCTSSGSQSRSCSCGKTESKSISALGHNYSSNWTVDTAATCITSGSKSHHCTRCSSKSSVTPIAATGHSWGNWKTIINSTCTDKGKQERSCSKCSAKEAQDISANGHTFSSKWFIDAKSSCTVAGTKSKHCTVCSAKTEITTVDAIGHNWSDFKIITKATVEKQGLSKRICLNNCGEEETKTIPKLASDGHTHLFGEWSTVKEASCVDDGIKQRTCSICGEYETMSISMLGHNFGEWSTEAKDGIVERICGLCGSFENHTVESETPIEITNDSNIDDEYLEESVNINNENKQDGKNKLLGIIIFSVLGLAIMSGMVFCIIKFIVKPKHQKSEI